MDKAGQRCAHSGPVPFRAIGDGRTHWTWRSRNLNGSFAVSSNRATEPGTRAISSAHISFSAMTSSMSSPPHGRRPGRSAAGPRWSSSSRTSAAVRRSSQCRHPARSRSARLGGAEPRCRYTNWDLEWDLRGIRLGGPCLAVNAREAVREPQKRRQNLPICRKKSGRLDLNQRPFGPQPTGGGCRCVPERPDRPIRPRSWTIWTHRTMRWVPKRYHESLQLRMETPPRVGPAIRGQSEPTGAGPKRQGRSISAPISWLMWCSRHPRSWCGRRDRSTRRGGT